MIVDGMQGSTIFSTLDLMDGFYQILMREKDVPLTAVSTPSGMLWEWLVMPQGLKNAPATFNRCVSHLLRPIRQFAPSYFDDVFIHSRAQEGKSDVDVHREHLRALFVLMRKHKLYANLKKCLFGVEEIPVLGDLVGKNGVRPDPEKVRVIKDWPTPTSVKDLRKFLGLAAYLHKYSKNFAGHTFALSQLLRKEAEWIWTAECQQSFNAIKKSLIEAPVLKIADHAKDFHVVCDASDFAIGSALMQFDDDGNERVVSYASRQLRAAEKNYPVHDKELLSMKYALTKFRVYLLGSKPFKVYTDHASLRTAIKTPHLSQRMARWLSFFADYNFEVLYKPGKLNVVADALSRRPDYEQSVRSKDETVNLTITQVSTDLLDQIKVAYDHDDQVLSLVKYLSDPSPKLKSSLTSLVRSRLHRYVLSDGVLYFRTEEGDDWRVVVPSDYDLRNRILFEYHDAPTAGHPGREKTYLNVSRDFYWNNQYSFVRKYVRTCEICQRMKPSSASQAPLHSLPVPQDCWQSVSMDYVFGFPKINHKTGVLVFVDRFSKMVHLTAVSENITSQQTAQIFMESVFKLHGMPREIVSDRDPRFNATFWRQVFRLLGSQLSMSTTDHPETDGQTERVNRVLGDILRCYAHAFEHWTDLLPIAEFAINNSVHASTGMTPFFVNGFRHPRVPSTLMRVSASLSEGGTVDSSPLSLNRNDSSDSQRNHNGVVESQRLTLLDSSHESDQDLDQPEDNQIVSAISENNISVLPNSERFIVQREAVLRFVRDAICQAVDKQKENADKKGRRNLNEFKVGSLVLLNTSGLPAHSVSNLGSNKLLPRFIGPFKVLKRIAEAYTLDIPSKMKLHPTFYVGRLKSYHSSNAFDGDRSHHNSDDQNDRSRAPSRRVHVGVDPTCEQENRLFDRDESRVPEDDQSSDLEADNLRNSIANKRVFRRAPPPLIDSAGERRYIVEKLVEHSAPSRNASARTFRVRWLGFPSSSDSWEPREHLMEDVPDIVLDYERRHNLPPLDNRHQLHRKVSA
jgi:transposase InsO family protein